jgi:hypothetical protein
MRGSRATLLIRQDSAEHYQPTLYIEPLRPDSLFGQTLAAQFTALEAKYPGITLARQANGWVVGIPDHYKEGHEAHFARVTEKFLEYLKDHDMPAWEVPNMIAKYYTTTKALELAKQNH